MSGSYESIRVKISELSESYIVHEIKEYFKGNCIENSLSDDLWLELENVLYNNTWYELVYDNPRSAEYFRLTAKIEPIVKSEFIFIVKPEIKLEYMNPDRRISLKTYKFDEIRTMFEYVKMFKNILGGLNDTDRKGV